MAKEMSESWVKGYATAKRISGVYPVQIDTEADLDFDEFVRGLRFGGYYGEVTFHVCN